MSGFAEAREGHPAGEGPCAAREVAREAVKVDTFGGTVHVEWDPDAAVTPLGHLAFFAEYLKVSGRFDALVADCPLVYTSPNAPSKRDVLGTVLLSVLAGQSRYAHITALRGDGVNPSLLGMGKVASEDSVRRGLERIGADEGTSWLQGHLDDTIRPLLSEPWVLDCDTTIKPLYGHQEGAVVSYIRLCDRNDARALAEIAVTPPVTLLSATVLRTGGDAAGDRSARNGGNAGEGFSPLFPRPGLPAYPVCGNDKEEKGHDQRLDGQRCGRESGDPETGATDTQPSHGYDGMLN